MPAVDPAAASGSAAGWLPSPGFWKDEFPSATANMTAPFLFESLVPTDVLGPQDMLAGLRRLRAAAAAQEHAAARMRVYLGEDRRDDLVAKVLSAPWDDGADFLPWMQSTCGAERFSLVVNNLETTVSGLAHPLGLLIQAAFAAWGMPIGGCEQVAFAGNYASTAFGVHEGFEDAFLVHLGPGVKDFYCWSGELYRELTGGADPTFGDYEWLLKRGQKFSLTPGSLLFLPRRVYHVGVQDEFSVSVAIPFYTFPDRRLLARQVLRPLLDSIETADQTPSGMHSLQAGPDLVAASLTPTATAMLDTASELAAAAVRDHITTRWNTLRSNGGWEPSDHDLARADAAAAALAAYDNGGSHMRVAAPYSLIVGPELDDALTFPVYLRGMCTRVGEAPQLCAILADLAAGNTVAIPEQARGEVLIRLLRTGGIEILSDDTKEP